MPLQAGEARPRGFCRPAADQGREGLGFRGAHQPCGQGAELSSAGAVPPAAGSIQWVPVAVQTGTSPRASAGWVAITRPGSSRAGSARFSMVDRPRRRSGCGARLHPDRHTGPPEPTRGRQQGQQAQAAGRPEAGRTSLSLRHLQSGTFRRSALATTISEESDIAIAAISGVTRPATAIGTASTL